MGFIQVVGTEWANRLFMLSLLLAFAGAMFASAPRAAAQTSDPSGPDRYAVTVVDYTKYIWFMFYNGEDDIECKIVVDHEGLPTPGEVYTDCGRSEEHTSELQSQSN